ncbi:hypothetical protein GQ42DRAFT_138996 [Ramicandelaber brevisporus]|nr:hypothetical protein GQ42DRAFT_138996 [Ramicandelaber brevisporus]
MVRLSVVFTAALALAAATATAEAAHHGKGKKPAPRSRPFGPVLDSRHNVITSAGQLTPSERRHLVGQVSARARGRHARTAQHAATAAGADPVYLALQYARSQHPGSHFDVTSAYESQPSGVTHVYLRQLVNGLEIANADMNINVAKDGSILSSGSSFVDNAETAVLRGTSSSSLNDDQPAARLSWPLHQLHTIKGKVKSFVTETMMGIERSDDSIDVKHLSPEEALVAFAKHIEEQSSVSNPSQMKLEPSHDQELVGRGGPAFDLHNTGITVDNKPVPIRAAYIQTDSGVLRRVWDLRVEQDYHWYHALVDSATGKVLQLVDWTSDATYNVYPLGVNDPEDGERELVVNPEISDASPLGWHDNGRVNSTKTQGNNVYAHENFDGGNSWRNNYRPSGGKNLVFDFPIDFNKQPKSYIDAAVTNLFYWNNAIHDLFYLYGFTEKAGNFQDNNFGNGGKENDAVIAGAQDGQGYMNAWFQTPPDGQHGKMAMFIWNGVTPHRDGDLEGGIIMHEYAHGISTRLTGGPANSGCLGWGEAGGMGEGWGDFFATILRQTKDHNRDNAIFEMGLYANGGKGIRHYPYSTDLKTNPHTYKILDNPSYWGVHAIGEVWAAMLYEVYWNLVDKHGWTDDWHSADIRYGNTLALQLVVEGMKLQPCRPSFVAARDAILLADRQLTGGENQCEIYKGFAKRGLGKGANIRGDLPWGGGIHTESFKLPAACLA